MARIVIELTNRCNLSCQHCFSGRHGGTDDLPQSILDRVLAEAAELGFDNLSFTGGDPTLHPEFDEIIRRTAKSGLRFGMVTNGWNFASKYPVLLRFRDQLDVITFSLDGATEQTHDRLRGTGSFRRVRQAASVCVIKEIPFSFNMVVTRHNRHEIAQMADLAHGSGSRGLRFGHLMPAPLTTAQGFDLAPAERREVETEIRELQQRQDLLTIGMAPGYFTKELFPCAPLQLLEANIDCRGNLTKCCHLSGHGSGVGESDIAGNLAEMKLADAYCRLVAKNEKFHAAKLQWFSSGKNRDTDFYPCWYCSLHHAKVDWLGKHEQHPWAQAIRKDLSPPTSTSTT